MHDKTPDETHQTPRGRPTHASVVAALTIPRGRLPASGDPEADDPFEARRQTEYKAFAVVSRQDAPLPAFQLWWYVEDRSGRQALGVEYLEVMYTELKASSRVMLHCRHATITLEGSHLTTAFFDRLTEHRVLWIGV